MHDFARGDHWVRGESYKARVNGEGFTFIPFLGSDAPRGWPVHFRLQETSVGGVALELNERAEVVRDGDTFFLERGPVTVQYDVALDSAEQLFHIESDGFSGEIVVTLDVSTDLEGSPRGLSLIHI